MPLGYPQRPEDLLIDAEGRAQRIDKAFSWEAPLAIHGQLHSVIRNAWAGDPYPIDTLFLYMANMAWNSAMNTEETRRMLTDRDPQSGEYRIPHILYADAYRSEMVAFADLVLPDTTYLERWDCISLLDRPISRADAAADAIRQPVVKPDRDVRAFQDVLIDLGHRLRLPGFADAEGRALYPGGLVDYMRYHERRPDVGMLAGWRGATGALSGKGAANPGQLDRYIENDGFWTSPIPEAARYFRFGNRAYLDWATEMGFLDRAEPIILQIYSEALRRFQSAAEGFGDLQPPDHLRADLAASCAPFPIWRPIASADPDYPLHALTQRPMHMYHSWGSQNAWLRQIQTRNPLFVHPETARALGLSDGDLAWAESRIGRIRVEIKTMAGLEPHTVWTWNAIAKAEGAWNLSPQAPEIRRAFLLNHLIDDLAEPGPGPARRANADPVTGQAAWFDLRVRLTKCRPGEDSP